ncbi:MAG: hypothetical protein LBU89_08595 [Fibromonadaceae bacterium]|jgi:hypothetical protein|nr:hypothetical protein [Fibromonadaceae bacterium]
MFKRISLVLVLLLFCSEFVWAQRTRAAQEDDRAARRQFEEEQRADEYATSLRRRDWLKDRLILQLGMGTKYPAMGADWFGFGAGVEYITRWHVAGFLSGGFIPPSDDRNHPDDFSLDGGMGWRIGVAYYMFPKSPIHLGFHLSYGTVFFDHKSKPDGFDEIYAEHAAKGEPVGKMPRSIITCLGYEFDMSITYLSDQWYFLQAMVGVYTIGNGLKDGGNTMGRTNNSWEWDLENSTYYSLVSSSDRESKAIPPVGIVFGIGIGFAFEEFFPDDTEVRRRERERGRTVQGQGQFRSTPAGGSGSRPSAPPRRPAPRPAADEYEDY